MIVSTSVEDAAFCVARAFTKARTSSAALKAVADYTRKHSSIFVVDGPNLLDRSEKARRRKTIETIADKLDELAVAAAEGRLAVDYEIGLVLIPVRVRRWPSVSGWGRSTLRCGWICPAALRWFLGRVRASMYG